MERVELDGSQVDCLLVGLHMLRKSYENVTYTLEGAVMCADVSTDTIVSGPDYEQLLALGWSCGDHRLFTYPLERKAKPLQKVIRTYYIVQDYDEFYLINGRFPEIFKRIRDGEPMDAHDFDYDFSTLKEAQDFCEERGYVVLDTYIDEEEDGV